MRPKHYVKNLLVFVPMFFAGAIFDKGKLVPVAIGFACWCLASSAIYILNDLLDVERDRKHPTKCHRPIASERVSKSAAMAMLAGCLTAAIIVSALLGSISGGCCLLVYFILNVLYSLGLKNKPIVDVAILASGYIIRVFYGGFLANVPISNWLYLVITTGSLYMGLGKRRNELRAKTDTRAVLKFYTEEFLDKNMYVCVALANVFYALWAVELPNRMISWTIPLFIVLLMRYSLDIEGDSDGDPIEVVSKDKVLIGIVLSYAACIFAMLYWA